MKIIKTKNIGFCFGVKRTLKIIDDLLRNSKGPFFMLEPVVHNEEIMKKLKKKGVKLVESLGKVKKGTLIISAHGERQDIVKKAKSKGLKIVDTTCPLVRGVQNLAKKFQEKNYQVIIVGDKNHKEVKGILGATRDKGMVIDNKKDISRINIKDPIALFSQTTQELDKVQDIFKRLKNKYKEIKFLNTVCPACQRRQQEVKNLAKKVDLVLILGSKSSANTKRLFEISKKINRNTVWLKNAGDLKKELIAGAKNVGISSGTSAPDFIIKEVVKKINNFSSGGFFNPTARRPKE